MSNNVVYEDELVTEYRDGTEEVRFTDAEWAVMMEDPAYGYVCVRGHRIDRPGSWDAAEGCMNCFNEREAAYADEQYAAERSGR